MNSHAPLILFGLLGIALVMQAFNQRHATSPPLVVPHMEAAIQATDTLFVLVHGMSSSHRDAWQDFLGALKPAGDVLRFDYPASPWSNADPEWIARRINKEIQREYHLRHYHRVVLIGHSMGALLARRAFLIGAAGQPAAAEQSWVTVCDRIILAAGMNRGWEAGGLRPLDMSWRRYLEFTVGPWLARLLGIGGFVLQGEVGAPFVANLRLDWMHYFRDGAQEIVRVPMVVQVLGDIDDVVSAEDSKDLATNSSTGFYWLKVRGADHASILDLHSNGDATSTFPGSGAYRLAKFMLAINGAPEAIARQSETLPLNTDRNITHLIFVLHGIRDLGGWAADFETTVEQESQRRNLPGRVRIINPRYGYFSAGSFMLRPDREQLTRWFVDAYTEAVATYPAAHRIDFFGHSNGTYVLANALRDYRAMVAQKLVFAGSVLPTDFDWRRIVAEQDRQHASGDTPRVVAVRNYVARDDMVVALLPRFFEQRGVRWMGNDIGSAGFNGFDPGPDWVRNVGFLDGGHSAFLSQLKPIVDYFLDAPDTRYAQEEAVVSASRGDWTWLKFVSDYFTWLLWLIAFVIIMGAGVRFVLPSRHLWSVLLALLAYTTLVLGVLVTF